MANRGLGFARQQRDQPETWQEFQARKKREAEERYRWEQNQKLKKLQERGEIFLDQNGNPQWRDGRPHIAERATNFALKGLGFLPGPHQEVLSPAQKLSDSWKGDPPPGPTEVPIQRGARLPGRGGSVPSTKNSGSGPRYDENPSPGAWKPRRGTEQYNQRVQQLVRRRYAALKDKQHWREYVAKNPVNKREAMGHLRDLDFDIQRIDDELRNLDM